MAELAGPVEREEDMTDQERLRFLLALDRAEFSVTAWEASFLDSLLTRKQVTFSLKQRMVIDRMVAKYREKLFG